MYIQVKVNDKFNRFSSETFLLHLNNKFNSQVPFFDGQGLLFVYIISRIVFFFSLLHILRCGELLALSEREVSGYYSNDDLFDVASIEIEGRR